MHPQNPVKVVSQSIKIVSLILVNSAPTILRDGSIMNYVRATLGVYKHIENIK
jgi:hypothetical protein